MNNASFAKNRINKMRRYKGMYASNKESFCLQIMVCLEFAFKDKYESNISNIHEESIKNLMTIGAANRVINTMPHLQEPLGDKYCELVCDAALALLNDMVPDGK